MGSNDSQKAIEALVERYRARLKEQLRKGGRMDVQSDSGYAVSPLYTPLDLEGFDYADELGVPGEAPFTRGVQSSMYRGRPWTMRQYAGFGTAEESNARYRYLLEQGQTGLSVAFDLPTQMGLDSDDPLAEGEVGKVGVAIDTFDDMETLFSNIPLDKVSTSMTINATAFILLALYIAVAEKQGVAQEKLSGTIQNDILKEYVARGTYVFPPRPSLKIITDVFEHAAANLPKFNTISISGYHIREAGSTAAQEIAFTLQDGATYVEAAVQAGLDVNVFGERLSFFFNAHNNFLEEVAKFRAARRLWARIMKERFGAANPKACMLRFHTQTAGSSLTAQQPEVNVVRVTLQALAAVLGGTQSLHTNSRDEALGLPTQESATLALRTQQVIAFESGACDTADPLGGSYAIEAMTGELEKRAAAIMADVEKRGGMIQAIENGWVQEQIQDAAYKYQQAIEKGERVIVGVNRFCENGGGTVSVLKVDPALEKEQVQRLKAVKAQRDNGRVRKLLSALEGAAREGTNIMAPTLDAVRAYASVGEITSALRKVYGSHSAR